MLGEGASSTVYAATQLALGRPVAIKVLRAPQLDARSEQRFLREAQAISRLAHPHVVQVHDFGIDEAHARAFLVLERVEGETLTARLRSRGALAEAEAARLMAQVARALAHAHARGLVHRDVKPANLMLTDLGDGHGESIKVLDFGLAKLTVDEGTPGLTAPGAALGTLEFASPEQILGQPAQASSDLYALGCVLFAGLTARAPWGAASTVAQAQARLRGPPPSLPPRLVDGRAPSARVVELLARLMLREPEARPQDAAQVAAELEAIAREAGGAPQPAAPAPTPARRSTAEIAAASTVAPAPSPARRSTREIAAASTVAPTAPPPALDLANTAPTPLINAPEVATSPTALALDLEPLTARALEPATASTTALITSPSTDPVLDAPNARTPAEPATRRAFGTAPTRPALADPSAPRPSLPAPRRSRSAAILAALAALALVLALGLGRGLGSGSEAPPSAAPTPPSAAPTPPPRAPDPTQPPPAVGAVAATATITTASVAGSTTAIARERSAAERLPARPPSSAPARPSPARPSSSGAAPSSPRPTPYEFW